MAYRPHKDAGSNQRKWKVQRSCGRIVLILLEGQQGYSVFICKTSGTKCMGVSFHASFPTLRIPNGCLQFISCTNYLEYTQTPHIKAQSHKTVPTSDSRHMSPVGCVHLTNCFHIPCLRNSGKCFTYYAGLLLRDTTREEPIGRAA